MTLKRTLSFALLFSLALLFIACDNGVEKRKEYYDNGKIKSITMYRKDAFCCRFSVEKDELTFFKHNKDLYKEGPYISFYENGKLREKGSYKLGEKNGVWTNWYEKGQKMSEELYKSGLLFKSKNWYENGPKKSEKHFFNGVFAVPDCKTYRYLFRIWDRFEMSECQGLPDGDGFETMWYENGKLKELGYYKAGKKYSAWRTWYENGKLSSETIFDSNNNELVYKEWHESGMLMLKGTYKDNKRNGAWTNWFENGQIKEDTFYKNGRPFTSKSWYENGRIESEKQFSNGGLTSDCEFLLVVSRAVRDPKPPKCLDHSVGDGFEKTWYANGKKKSEKYYKAGKKYGAWRAWHGNGKIAEMGHYNAGKHVGARKTWFENGHIETEEFYDNGKFVGMWKKYHENGRLAMIQSYKAGEKNGVWKEWFENGQLVYEGHYKDGEKVGVWKEWNKKGELINEQNWDKVEKVNNWDEIKKWILETPRKRIPLRGIL